MKKITSTLLGMILCCAYLYAEADLKNVLHISWPEQPNVAIYELQVSNNSQFVPYDQHAYSYGGTLNYITSFWPSAAQETVVLSSLQQLPYAKGEYYLRVRGWSDLPESGGAAGEWVEINMNQEELLELAPIRQISEDALEVSWNKTSSKIYELQVSNNDQFVPYDQHSYSYGGGLNYITSFWPSTSKELVTLSALQQLPYAKGEYYLRVRGWSDLPENGGISGSWSNVQTLTRASSVKPWFQYKEKNYVVHWNEVKGIKFYEVIRSNDPEFGVSERFYPSSPFEELNYEKDLIYHKVRCIDWQDIPGEWSNVIALNKDSIEKSYPAKKELSEGSSWRKK